MLLYAKSRPQVTHLVTKKRKAHAKHFRTNYLQLAFNSQLIGERLFSSFFVHRCCLGPKLVTFDNNAIVSNVTYNQYNQLKQHYCSSFLVEHRRVRISLSTNKCVFGEAGIWDHVLALLTRAFSLRLFGLTASVMAALSPLESVSSSVLNSLSGSTKAVSTFANALTKPRTGVASVVLCASGFIVALSIIILMLIS